ncbi:MAG: hypothetical protein ACSLE3_01795, partial [Microbacteriaceae bacterium]
MRRQLLRTAIRRRRAGTARADPPSYRGDDLSGPDQIVRDLKSSLAEDEHLASLLQGSPQRARERTGKNLNPTLYGAPDGARDLGGVPLLGLRFECRGHDSRVRAFGEALSPRHGRR